MINNKIQFEFTCPKPFKELKKQSETTYFCDTCVKCVYDLSDQSNEKIHRFLQKNEGVCVRLHANTIHQPNGNWKDKLLQFNQFLESRHKNVKGARLLMVFMPFLFFITQCKTHYQGGPNLSEKGSSKSENVKNDVMKDLRLDQNSSEEDV